MKILFVTGECTPFAKTGGLADVSGSLPKALRHYKADVTVIMPRYRKVNQNEHKLKYVGDFGMPFGNATESVIIKKGFIDGKIPVYFIDNHRFFDRDSLYGYADDFERFLFFSRAVPEVARFLGLKSDIVHCNDWFTGLVPALVRCSYWNDPLFKGSRLVFSIHNLAYQGTAPKEFMPLTGLGWEQYHHGFEYYDGINLMKAGITFSDAVSTVSEQYAREIQTAEFGEGLDGLLRHRSKDLWGILNGADYEEWSPMTDPNLNGLNFDFSTFHRKEEVKKALMAELGLLPGVEPLIGIVSRLVDQKGFDMVGAVAEKIMALPVKIAILGTGQEEYHKLFLDLAQRYPGRVSVNFAFNNPLAHRIEAGSDMFLMPSRYEPCGLNQIYSMKYGTIPIVRATGGLADTVSDFTSNPDQGTGFSFYDYHGDYLVDAISRAVGCYFEPLTWIRVVENAMKTDFSWGRSAERYMEMYSQILSR